MALMTGKVEGVDEDGGGEDSERAENEGRSDSLVEVVLWRKETLLVLGLDEVRLRGGFKRENVRDIILVLDSLLCCFSLYQLIILVALLPLQMYWKLLRNMSILPCASPFFAPHDSVRIWFRVFRHDCVSLPKVFFCLKVDCVPVLPLCRMLCACV